MIIRPLLTLIGYMYKPFKALLTRPTGVVLIDKFQRDVVEAIKAFALTVYNNLNDGLVPAPKVQTPHTLVLWDDGWAVP